jgi:hypothetical protein
VAEEARLYVDRSSSPDASDDRRGATRIDILYPVEGRGTR